jgi:hypothetical protein
MPCILKCRMKRCVVIEAVFRVVVCVAGSKQKRRQNWRKEWHLSKYVRSVAWVGSWCRRPKCRAVRCEACVAKKMAANRSGAEMKCDQNKRRQSKANIETQCQSIRITICESERACWIIRNWACRTVISKSVIKKQAAGRKSSSKSAKCISQL